MWVKFESIYTETDMYGNQRRWENRFEAVGTAQEVCYLVDNLIRKIGLPGTRSIGLPYDVGEFLSSRKRGRNCRELDE